MLVFRPCFNLYPENIVLPQNTCCVLAAMPITKVTKQFFETLVTTNNRPCRDYSSYKLCRQTIQTIGPTWDKTFTVLLTKILLKVEIKTHTNSYKLDLPINSLIICRLKVEFIPFCAFKQL